MFIRGLLDLTDNVVGGAVVPPDRDGAPRRRRPVPRGRGRQGHGHVLRHRQRRRRRVRLLARRRVRLGRQRRLRPQGDGHHGPRRVGERAAPLPGARQGRRRPTSSPSWASATCRATCSATACCARRHVRLVAAFDHRHVFLDPTPTRPRRSPSAGGCSTLPRSWWADYDPTLISAGGGVYTARGEDDRALAGGARALGIERRAADTERADQAILRAPVDLLWNGGIGTYVKASSETHAEVGDRANDGVRVNGARPALPDGRRGRQPRLHPAGPHRVRARRRPDQHRRDRQLGRRRLLRPRGEHQDPARRRGADGRADRRSSATTCSTSWPTRSRELVLDDNRAQTLALIIARAQGLPMVNVHARYLDLLESEGWLNRELEFLPERQAARRAAVRRAA